jgi:hypothetical protein
MLLNRNITTIATKIILRGVPKLFYGHDFMKTVIIMNLYNSSVNACYNAKMPAGSV